MTDMTDQLRRLVEGLYLKTNQQGVEWRSDQADSLCEAAIGDGYVQVLQEADDEGDFYSYVRVLNASRDVIDTIYGGSLGKDKKPTNTAHQNYWQLMSDLYSSARRSSLGADKIVNNIVDALGVATLNVNDPLF